MIANGAAGVTVPRQWWPPHGAGGREGCVKPPCRGKLALNRIGCTGNGRSWFWLCINCDAMEAKRRRDRQHQRRRRSCVMRARQCSCRLKAAAKPLGGRYLLARLSCTHVGASNRCNRELGTICPCLKHWLCFGVTATLADFTPPKSTDRWCKRPRRQSQSRRGRRRGRSVSPVDLAKKARAAWYGPQRTFARCLRYEVEIEWRLEAPGLSRSRPWGLEFDARSRVRLRSSPRGISATMPCCRQDR